VNAGSDDDAVVVPGYTVHRRIGEGGFATVFEATQDDVGATVALKVLATGVGTAQSRRRLEREYRSMGRLRDLRGIVPVYGTTATAEGLPVIVMAYMAGGSLLDRVRTRGPLPADEVLHVVEIIGDALEAAHAAGIHHRDIKPENILLDRYGEPALSDFGIASVEGIEDASQTAASLSPPHAPPERFTGSGPVDPAAGDIYSLASTLHQLLTGRPPFGSTGDGGIAALILRITGDAPPRIERPDVPAALADTILAGLAKSPADRPTTAREFVRRARGEAPIAAAEPTIVPSGSPLGAEPTASTTIGSAETYALTGRAGDPEPTIGNAETGPLPTGAGPAPEPTAPSIAEPAAPAADAPTAPAAPATGRARGRFLAVLAGIAVAIGIAVYLTSGGGEDPGRSGSSGPSPTTAICSGDDCWTSVPLANFAGSGFLADVSCPTATACWAVGTRRGSTDTMLLARHDGDSWRAVDAPTSADGTASALAAVTCASADQCWAVGADGFDALVMRWNGNTWTVVPTPATTSAPEVLNDVTCVTPSLCWAVGNAQLILRWDGTSWATVRTAGASTSAGNLYNVTCTGPANCWAFGGTNPLDRAIILRASGSSWRPVRFPALRRAGTERAIYGASCVNATDCWIVGWGLGGAARWNGSAWTNFPLPAGNESLRAIDCISASSCWATGEVAALAHWDGSAWDSADAPDGTGNLGSVDCTAPTACWAVGSDDAPVPGGAPRILRFASTAP